AAFRMRPMGCAGRKTQPASGSMPAGLVLEFAVDHEQFDAVIVTDRAAFDSRCPALDADAIGESVLYIKQPALDASRGRLPAAAPRINDDVQAIASGVLAQLDEQSAAALRKRRVAETFGIQEVGAGRPVAVFVREHAVEHEDLLAVRMIVRRERRVRLV